ncbi:hypoxanthine phosphoribosyltransferase [Saprospiraceae bacterium]|jgi:hypoxanthine phosphoribosyltransferase|nr:hypoxanthine phosphoribosyltransferase [Bacteroidota bacterium]MDB4727462.1 hypoxanthine phosphoribosyltransferase [Saprospiraceae bacterium]MDF1865413.1 hypoxanthine phosphoribosyltransferase [Saprospiraceae bacterium]
MDNTIKIHDLYFKPFLTKEMIEEKVQEMAGEIDRDFKGKKPIFLVILNGSFIFAADLSRACKLSYEIAFMKLSSYDGLQSSGEVKTVFGLDREIQGRDLIIIEDIIDSGKTMHEFLPKLKAMNPASVSLAVLLLKPEAVNYPIKIDYLGFEIPDKFVIGYGLDYDEMGRDLGDIYQLIEEE